MLRAATKKAPEVFQEEVGCIEIMDNVYIGANCTILGNVRIGPNAIIGAGAIVTCDIPENSVAIGVPARVIGNFDEFAARRKNVYRYPNEIRPLRQTVNDELEEYMWKNFYESRDITDSIIRG